MTFAQVIWAEVRAAAPIIAAIAIWWGARPWDVWPAEIALFVVLTFGCALVIFIARMVFGGMLGLILSCSAIAICAVIAWQMWSYRASLFPQEHRYSLSENIPASLHFETRGSRPLIWVTITNQSDDWLRSAIVRCQLFMENGTPIEKRFSYSLANGYRGKGESAGNRVVSDYDIRDFRADASQTECFIESAQFMQRPRHYTHVEFSYDRRHWKHIFTIHNLGGGDIANIQLQCLGNNGINRRIPVTGRWELDPRRCDHTRGLKLRIHSSQHVVSRIDPMQRHQRRSCGSINQKPAQAIL